MLVSFRGFTSLHKEFKYNVIHMTLSGILSLVLNLYSIYCLHSISILLRPKG